MTVYPLIIALFVRIRGSYTQWVHTKNREPLVDILLRLPTQYPTVTHDYHHILKSIIYFKDADEDVMPQLNFKVTWKEVKRYFEREAPLVSKTLMELSD